MDKSGLINIDIVVCNQFFKTLNTYRIFDLSIFCHGLNLLSVIRYCLYFPIGEGTEFGREVGTNEYFCARVGHEWVGIAVLLYLGEGVLRRSVDLEFENIDEGGCFQRQVASAACGMNLCSHIESQHLEYDSHHILEMNLLVWFVLGICRGYKGLQRLQETVGLTRIDISQEFPDIESGEAGILQ